MNATDPVQAVAEALERHRPTIGSPHVCICGLRPGGPAWVLDHMAEVAVEAAREPIIQDFLERRDMPSVRIENPEDVRPFIEREVRAEVEASAREQVLNMAVHHSSAIAEREGMMSAVEWPYLTQKSLDLLRVAGYGRTVDQITEDVGAMLDQARAEALRDAAQALPFPIDPYGGFDHESLRAAQVQHQNALRDRADRIARAAEGGGSE